MHLKPVPYYTSHRMLKKKNFELWKLFDEAKICRSSNKLVPKLYIIRFKEALRYPDAYDINVLRETLLYLS